MLSRARVPQLLYTASDLLGGTALPRRLKDVVCDKLVAHREAAQDAIGLCLGRAIPLKPWYLVSTTDPTLSGLDITFDEGRLELWWPDSLFLSLHVPPTLARVEDGLDGLACPCIGAIDG